MDILGLIRWKGAFDYFGAGPYIQPFGMDFQLISECVNNVAYYAHIDATAVATDLPLPASSGRSSPWDNIHITDTASSPNPFSLSGVFAFGSAGASVGNTGKGVVVVAIGQGTGAYTGNTTMGLDFGVGGGFGVSRVVSFEEMNFPDDCACEKWNNENFAN